MYTRLRTILSITVALAMITVAALTVAVDQPAYAKGSVRSSGENKSRSESNSNSKSDSGSSSRSNSNSNSRSDSGSSSRSDSHSSNSDSSSGSHSSNSQSDSHNSNQQSNARSSNSQSDSHNSNQSSSRSSSSSSSDRPGVSNRSSSSQSDLDSRYNVRRYESPYSSPRSGLDQQYRAPGSRIDTKRPTPTYRKDYADIGDIWKNRQESRSKSSDHRWDTRRDNDRPSLYYDRPYDRNWRTQSYHSPFRYRYYSYDYRPRDCYPSLYCYYYDYFPPYVSCDRVFISARWHSPRIYIEIPIFIYQRQSDYYLKDQVDRQLWAVLRDIQRGWEISDPELVMRHAKRDGPIDVFMKDEYTYSVDWPDYYDMTRDAMSVIRTRSFDFDRVTRRDKDFYVAHGRHTYADESGLLKTVYISYTFERNGGQWYIIGLGSSTMPI